MKFRRIEVTLLCTLAVLFAYAAGVSLAREHLADGLVRLHVIANSDSAADQALKLRVRDRVLAVTEPLLRGADSPADVRQRLSDHLQEITDAGAQVLREAVEQSLGELDGELLKLMERMSTLKRLEQLLDSGEPRWGSAAQLIERSQHSAQAFWETLVDEDAPEEQGLGRAEVMSWHKLMSDAIELMQNEVPASDQRALELGERFAELGGNERALVGLGKMRSGTASKGCTLYESLQKRTLLYLNACLDALQEER